MYTWSTSGMTNTSATQSPTLINGKPEGDTYAVSLLCPSRYGFGMFEQTCYRNMRACSAAEVLDHLDGNDRDRVVAIWPERF